MLNRLSKRHQPVAFTPKFTPVSVLALMMFLVPAVGVQRELMLQATLISAIVALCTPGATVHPGLGEK
jgi:hypothetical protein